MVKQERTSERDVPNKLLTNRKRSDLNILKQELWGIYVPPTKYGLT